MSTLRSKDRASLCSFSFADGRQCRTPRYSGHPRLCCFHACKEAQAQAAESIGRDISSRFSGSYLSACDLSSALGQVFTGVANGSIKRKTAATLAYLGQTMLNSIQAAQHEYINAFSTNSWRETIRSSFISDSPEDPDPQPSPTDCHHAKRSSSPVGAQHCYAPAMRDVKLRIVFAVHTVQVTHLE
jgi:hypothetical protein